MIETERGCAHNCRFCLVSSAFSPMRFHSVDSLLRQAEMGLKSRPRMGLVGPAVTDHPQIEGLFDQLLAIGARFSISSLRMTSLNSRIFGLMVKGGIRSVALAPEAGSQSLRGVIKKGLSESQILEAIGMAAAAGMQQLKLYFMVGLPQETESDIEAIADLTLTGKALLEKGRSKARLTLNISPFVPKAGTVFQRMPMMDLETVQDRVNLIRSKLAHQGVKINFESPQWSEVQTVLSRADSSLAAVLADISKESLPDWKEAVQKHHIDIEGFAHQKWDSARTLPWHFIISGNNGIKLPQELNQLFKE